MKGLVTESLKVFEIAEVEVGHLWQLLLLLRRRPATATALRTGTGISTSTSTSSSFLILIMLVQGCHPLTPARPPSSSSLQSRKPCAMM